MIDPALSPKALYNYLPFSDVQAARLPRHADGRTGPGAHFAQASGRAQFDDAPSFGSPPGCVSFDAAAAAASRPPLAPRSSPQQQQHPQHLLDYSAEATFARQAVGYDPAAQHIDPGLQALGSGRAFGAQAAPAGRAHDARARQSFAGPGAGRSFAPADGGAGSDSSGRIYAAPCPASSVFAAPDVGLPYAAHGQPFSPAAPNTSTVASPVAHHPPATPQNDGSSGASGSRHFSGLKLVFDPPELEAWRQRLFDVDGTLTLTEDEFQTYFPHVDNVYSHRSTQRYKRKPFVSHYWDCRLKGRPPGTPKSDDPTKKKRKRQARERDQCAVKVKITEFFPGARSELEAAHRRATKGRARGAAAGAAGDSAVDEESGPPADAASEGDAAAAARNGGKIPGADGRRYYTITRINGADKTGELASPHQHSLADSDRIKKSSVARELARVERERKKGPKTYHKRATGAALATVKAHSAEHELKLYGSCFCPFVQRVWIALELKGVAYQYIEVDPYAKPASLLALSPRGLVPALQHGELSLHESSVILEYIDDAFPSSSSSLLPPLPHAADRARARLWTDHATRRVLPAFYRTLQAQDPSKQAAHAAELRAELDKLVRAADAAGPFFAGATPGLVDVSVAPWLLRLPRVLAPYRGWPAAPPGSRFAAWLDALESCPQVARTVSDDQLYLDSYERYAENRPNTSQVADAINAGGALP